jgi:hypothetical protein
VSASAHGNPKEPQEQFVAVFVAQNYTSSAESTRFRDGRYSDAALKVVVFYVWF